jgi:hypothetical protein
MDRWRRGLRFVVGANALFVVVALAGACAPPGSTHPAGPTFDATIAYPGVAGEFATQNLQLSADGTRATLNQPSSSFADAQDLAVVDLASENVSTVVAAQSDLESETEVGVPSNGADAFVYSDPSGCYVHTPTGEVTVGDPGCPVLGSVSPDGTTWQHLTGSPHSLGNECVAFDGSVNLQLDFDSASQLQPLNHDSCLLDQHILVTPSGQSDPLDMTPGGSASTGSAVISPDNTKYAFVPSASVDVGVFGGCANGGILLRDVTAGTLTPVGFLPNGSCVDTTLSPTVVWISPDDHLVAFRYDSGTGPHTYLRDLVTRRTVQLPDDLNGALFSSTQDAAFYVVGNDIWRIDLHP